MIVDQLFLNLSKVIWVNPAVENSFLDSGSVSASAIRRMNARYFSSREHFESRIRLECFRIAFPFPWTWCNVLTATKGFPQAKGLNPQRSYFNPFFLSSCILASILADFSPR